MKGTWQTTSSSSGPVLAVAVIVALVLAVAGSAGAALHAAARAADELVTVVLIAVGSLAGLGVAGVVVALVLSRRRAARPTPYWAQVVHGPAQPTRPVVTRSAPRELPAARPPQEIHIHLHGASAEDIAAVRQAIRRD